MLLDNSQIRVYISNILQDASVAQMVEHHVANVIVVGSIPITRSIFFAQILNSKLFIT